MIVKLTKSQFFKLFPADSRVIQINDSVIPIGQDVVCDGCNKSIYDVDEDEIAYGFFDETRSFQITNLLCKDCYNRYYKDETVMEFDNYYESLKVNTVISRMNMQELVDFLLD